MPADQPRKRPRKSISLLGDQGDDSLSVENLQKSPKLIQNSENPSTFEETTTAKPWLYGPKGGRRYLTKDDPDLFNDKNAEVMPTPKRRKLIQNPESPQHNKGQLISE